jgi:5-formyltetrahydrofolate cyclo-ligase
MSEPRSDKAELRRQMRALRRSIAPSDQRTWSAAIAERLSDHPIFQRASSIHTFVGALEGEVETRAVIDHCLERGTRVICPRVADDDALEHFALTTLDELIVSGMGLWEPDPARCDLVDGPRPDVILVPGLAFDEAGGRLGLGRGYYDRFLADLTSTTIGLAFEAQVLEQVPVSERDVALDWVVTERRTLDSRKARA